MAPLASAVTQCMKMEHRWRSCSPASLHSRADVEQSFSLSHLGQLSRCDRPARTCTRPPLP
ncbi:hypothetical protein JZ751_009310 [Albula glossodonta]|uniref:Uncharacterized protein n=1 Tax=Albula glossodonta TaxID=121402 RepID=A0A8T2N1L0_9TELE|nr:hypothetical protein JZ751_009310 [Albula glossodonta]